MPLKFKIPKMEDVIANCECCGKAITRGAAYVCLARNIEQVEHSVSRQADEVEVIQSDMLLALCGRCGNRFDTDTLVRLIRLVPNGADGIAGN